MSIAFVRPGRFALVAGLLTGIGCSAPVGEGELLVCDRGRCTLDCPEGGCRFEVHDQSNAELTCSGGRCAAEVTDQATVKFDCGGGRCEVLCVDECDADLTCPEGGCAMRCEDIGTCTMIGCDDCDMECNGVNTDCRIR